MINHLEEAKQNILINSNQDLESHIIQFLCFTIRIAPQFYWVYLFRHNSKKTGHTRLENNQKRYTEKEQRDAVMYTLWIVRSCVWYLKHWPIFFYFKADLGARNGIIHWRHKRSWVVFIKSDLLAVELEECGLICHPVEWDLGNHFHLKNQ